jgi:hypothetical protein
MHVSPGNQQLGPENIFARSERALGKPRGPSAAGLHSGDDASSARPAISAGPARQLPWALKLGLAAAALILAATLFRYLGGTADESEPRALETRPTPERVAPVPGAALPRAGAPDDGDFHGVAEGRERVHRPRSGNSSRKSAPGEALAPPASPKPQLVPPPAPLTPAPAAPTPPSVSSPPRPARPEPLPVAPGALPEFM